MRYDLTRLHLLFGLCLLLAAPFSGAAQEDTDRKLFEHEREAPVRVVSAVVGPSQSQLDAAADNNRDWLYATGDYSMRRYVKLDEINRGNAHRLQPVCAFQAGDTRAFHTNPLVYDGVMYLTTRHDAIAIDARTCREIWRQTWDAQRETHAQANRGLGLKDGTLIWGTADGHLLALDASNGAIRWKLRHADPSGGEKFNMPPLLVDDLAVIGVAGSESGIRGWIGAFRLEDGAPVWRFDVVPAPGERGAETWGNAEALTQGGGGVWTPIAMDAERRHLYIGTANPAPAFYGAGRPGSNLFTNSLVVLEAETGALVWHNQFVPHDLLDRGVTSPGPLFTTVVNGQQRSLVATAGKDGVVRVLDRETHQVLYDVPVTTMLNEKGMPTPEGIQVCPGILGGVQWNGIAYSPHTDLLYAPAVDWCMTFYGGGDPADWMGPHLGGGIDLGTADDASGWLTAIDAPTGTIRWQYASTSPMVAPVVATAGGVLFTGDTSGDFLVFDDATGEVVYRFHTGGALGGGIATYALDGRQYVAATSGGTTQFWQRPGGSSTIFIFALPRDR